MNALTTTKLEKQKSHAFKKDVYLLGADVDGIKYWLEAPSWDCDWYWGFGYIETYPRNISPSKAKDVDSHTHANNFMSKWFTEWNGSKPILTEAVFTDKEGWELSELFEQFYFLQSAAENFGRGKCHTSDTIAPNWQNKPLSEKINKVLIPAVTKRILEILAP